MAKAYEGIGLTKDDVLEIQAWLFPMITETKNKSNMIIKTVDKFVGNKLHYALYLLGSELGAASVKEAMGLYHELNPENT